MLRKLAQRPGSVSSSTSLGRQAREPDFFTPSAGVLLNGLKATDRD